MDAWFGLMDKWVMLLFHHGLFLQPFLEGDSQVYHKVLNDETKVHEQTTQNQQFLNHPYLNNKLNLQHFTINTFKLTNKFSGLISR